MAVREKLRFATFELDLQTHELISKGRPVKLVPQALRLLEFLATHPGQLVTREEIRQEIWRQTTFVDFEQGINKSIRQIRDALNDDADRPRFVETLPRRGYRFIAKVESSENHSTAVPSVNSNHPATLIPPVTEALSGSSKAASVPESGVVREPARSAQSWMMIAAAAAIVLAIAGAVGFKFAVRTGSGQASSQDSQATLIRLIGLPGQEGMPAVSPDGSRVAFVWRAPDSKDSGIYEVVVGSQSVLRLTSNVRDYSPAWSPDGRQIAFLRDSGDQFSIRLLPVLGGPERELYVGQRGEIGRSNPQHAGVSFSPDGKWLAFAETAPPSPDDSIKLLSLKDSSVRIVTSHPPGFQDRYPVFSPDGNSLVFVRSSGPLYIDDLYLASLDRGDARRLTSDKHRIFGPPAFTSDGREILFSSNRAGLESLWRISVLGGSPQPVSGAGPGAQGPTVSQHGESLAYEISDDEQDIWQLKLQNETHAEGRPRILIPSGRSYNYLPQFSPDGRQIAFQSHRSGYGEIWICDADGSNLVQMTDNRTLTGSPRWSPDGRYLAFDSSVGSHSEIDLAEVPHGAPRTVARFPDADSSIPSWSHDGKWIYFSSNRGGKNFHVWKVEVKDGAAVATPIQISRNVGFNAIESLDGTSVLFADPPRPGIWSVPREGGQEEVIWEGQGPNLWSNWVVAKNGLYFVTNAVPGPEIEFLNLATRRVSHLARLDKPSFYGLALSPDGRSLIYSQQDHDDHQILLMKNFR